MFGVDISTVAGRLIIILFLDAGKSMSTTSSQTSLAYSSSVPVKLSGEYSNVHSVSEFSIAKSLINLAASNAIFFMPSLSWSKTTFLCNAEVEL